MPLTDLGLAFGVPEVALGSPAGSRLVGAAREGAGAALPIEAAGDARQQPCQDRAGTLGVLLDQQHGEPTGRGQQRTLLRDALVGHGVGLGRGGHEGAAEGDEEQQREHLLAHAIGVAGMELSLPEVVALLDTEQELDLPTQAVELLDVLGGERGALQAGQEHLWLTVLSLAEHRAQLERAEICHRAAPGWCEHDVGVHSSRSNEVVHRRKAAAAGHAQHEVDPPTEQQGDDLVAGIAPVEQQDVARTQVIQEPAQLFALAGGEGCDAGIDGDLGHHVEQRRDQDLGRVAGRRAAELLPQFGSALNGHLGAIDGQHASPPKAQPGSMLAVEGGRGVVQ